MKFLSYQVLTVGLIGGIHIESLDVIYEGGAIQMNDTCANDIYGCDFSTKNLTCIGDVVKGTDPPPLPIHHYKLCVEASGNCNINYTDWSYTPESGFLGGAKLISVSGATPTCTFGGTDGICSVDSDCNTNLDYKCAHWAQNGKIVSI